jgi:hypothetical protein
LRFVVKFYTLDDSLLFVLNRVNHCHQGLKSPMNVPPPPRLVHARSTSALPDPRLEPDAVRVSAKLYSSSILSSTTGKTMPTLRQLSI